MPSKTKVLTEAQKQARREYNRKYYRTHKQACNEADKLRRRKRAFGAERLNVDEILETSDLAGYIRNEMDTDNEPNDEYYKEFKQRLEGFGLTQEEIADVYYIAKRSSAANNSRRGSRFERSIKVALLNAIKDTRLHLYKQVPFEQSNDDCFRCRRIDFVISNENTHKDQLDLSKAIVISCKTGYSVEWRQDQCLFDKCKFYFMVTINGSIPRQQLPANVYFVAVNSSEPNSNSHVLSFEQMLDNILALGADVDGEESIDESDVDSIDESDEESEDED